MIIVTLLPILRFRTCYIAGEYIRMLKRKQPELGITEKDVLRIQIAALCRNLGKITLNNVPVN